MESTDRIKRRIRSLLNLAAGDAATEGEIDNAMRMAAQLMDEHHLTEADIAAAKLESDRSQPMGTADAVAVGARFSAWESSLAWAVVGLVGSVNHYVARDAEAKIGTFAAPKSGRGVRFYGPAEDCQLAADLFAEWAHVIATLATGKYGGCFRGDGAMYAMGFARQLLNRARETEKSRERISTDATKAIVHAVSGSLAQVLSEKRESGRKWLAESKGVKLVQGGRRSGYSAGSHDAYAAGKSDGSRAEFSVSRRSKLT